MTDQPKPCLIIVDDDGTARARLSAALGKDYDVVCLADGKDVVARIDESSPRLLILDLNDENDGSLAIHKAVREHSRNDSLPVLFRTMRAGGAKPWEMLQLKRCIAYLLSGER